MHKVLPPHFSKNLFRTFLAGILAVTIGLCGVVGSGLTASAGDGTGTGGDSGGGTGSGVDATKWAMVTGDDLGRMGNPYQGWGQDSINYFVNRLVASLPGAASAKNIQKTANTSCSVAIKRSLARSKGATKARVVGFYVALGKSNGKWVSWGSSDNKFVSNWTTQWNATRAASTFKSYSGGEVQKIYNAGLAEAKAVAASPAVGSRSVCIALNDMEPGYDLKISTAAQKSPGISGGSQAVYDQIRATSNASIKESLNANVLLHWDGFYGGTPKSVSKTMTINNNGTFNTPVFVPKDFGWEDWAAGKYWYDVKVARQKQMIRAVDTPDRVTSETFTLKPPPPVKTMHDSSGRLLDTKEIVVSAMPYLAKIKAHTSGAKNVEITDTILSKNVFVGGKEKDDFSNLYVTNSKGEKVDAQISVDDGNDGKRIVKAVVKDAPNGWYTLNVLTAPKPTKVKENLQNFATTCWDNDRKVCETSDKKEINKDIPDPNKAWVLDKGDGSLNWDVNDPDKTNKVGADEKTFNHGDKVGAVVNGHFPANMDDNLDRYVLIDNWEKSAKYVDFTRAHENAKVYVKIGDKWEDKTSFFDFSTSGTKTIATAKEGALSENGILIAGTKLLATDVQVKLVISGEFYPVTDETNTRGDTIKLFNEGMEIYNNEEMETNIPPVYVWNPNPDKDVLGQVEQAGPNTDASINNNNVFPGQKLQYRVGADMNLPNNPDRAYELKRFEIVDTYDKFFILNKNSIKIVDNRDRSRVIPRNQYKVIFNDKEHKFTIRFTQEWMDKQAKNLNHLPKFKDNKTDWLTLTFDGVVGNSIAAGGTVKNRAFQIVNDSTSPSNWVTNTVPPTEPKKEDLNKHGEDIDGKTVITGDNIVYRITMDASPLPANTDSDTKLAYWVHKLGIVDDYDEQYLDLEESGVKVVQVDTGKNVTEEFNIQVKDGKAYIFAKTKDYTNNQGILIKGDPQPQDLAAYDVEEIKPDGDPIINQELMGHKYHIYLSTTVKKSKDGYVIKNKAIQNLENMRQVTNIVSNPLQEITPDKDVVIEATPESKSVNGKTINPDQIFNYKLSSSILPANRANKTEQWGIRDDYDEKADQYTGKWLVVAERDIYGKDGEIVFKKGETIAKSANPLTKYFTLKEDKLVATVDITNGSKETVINKNQPLESIENVIKLDGDKVNILTDLYVGEEKILPQDSIIEKKELAKEIGENQPEYFTVTDKDGIITVEAQKQFLELVNTTKSMNTEQGWSAYINMRRIWVGTIKNQHIETHNNIERQSKQVETTTPETPQITLTKWDKNSGIKNGDRNNPNQALNVTQKETTIMFTIKNTGDVPLIDIKLTDKTVKGTGEINNITCPEEINQTLKPGEEITCQGTLTGIKPGTTHTNMATVTGKSYYTGTEIKADDPWNATTPTPPTPPTTPPMAKTGTNNTLPLAISLLATVLGATIVYTQRKKRRG